TIVIKDWHGQDTLDKEMQTDTSGVFTWPEAPPDSVKADVYAEGCGSLRDVVLQAGNPNEIRLHGQTRVNLTVLDAKTGKPLKGFNVRLGVVWHAGERLIWQPNRPG